MVNEQNIEQRIFEYHEGLMDAGQKKELMEFLHQYPECQREFALWAQARLHDEGVSTPVFQSKLIKPTAWVPSNLTKWTSGIVTASIAIILVFYFNGQKQETKTVKVFKADSKVLSIEKKKTVKLKVETPLASLKKAEVIKSKIKEQISVQSEEETKNTIQEKVEIPVSVQEEAKTVIQTEPKSEVQKDEEYNTDSYNAFADKPKEEELEPDEVKSQHVKKPKRTKQKMSLKPTPDILPTSPNF